jgi:4-alpha-glucanotransferase
VGSFGPAALDFVDALARAGQAVWQFLPLGPTGYGNSPYQALSSFGGNPLLVSEEWLADAGLLERAPAPVSTNPVDYERAAEEKVPRLHAAHAAFKSGAGPSELAGRYDAFREAEAAWVDDLALFLALKHRHGGKRWSEWPAELARRDAKALEGARRELVTEIDRHRFTQFLFFEHWGRVRERARERSIVLLGDLPIFVAEDSADVWAEPDLFDLDGDGRPRNVSGVPPDYFSATGQRWGNPLYLWDVHRERGFDWWIRRIRATLAQCDRIRIDHFRAFADYWEISADEETAIAGRWLTGPGADFFDAVKAALGELPIVAEDLGSLGEEAFALRDRYEFPGMRVLQFGFAPDPKFDAHSPHQFVSNCVAYTGTHDNNTVVGWFRSATNTTIDASEHGALQRRVLDYVGTDGTDIHWDLIRLALSSVADTAIVPVQDLLGLDGSARMNVPSRPDGNWVWRLGHNQFDDAAIDRLAHLTRIYGRWNDANPAADGASS